MVLSLEKVQLEGTIKGAKCTHFKMKCYNDDNHIALEPDFVFVTPKSEHYRKNDNRKAKAKGGSHAKILNII